MPGQHHHPTFNQSRVLLECSVCMAYERCASVTEKLYPIMIVIQPMYWQGIGPLPVRWLFGISRAWLENTGDLVTAC